MTAASLPHRSGDEIRSVTLPDDQPGLAIRIFEQLRPDEGWASIPLVLLLVGTMAWSIADSRWILGHNDPTAFVIWIACAAALWGYVSARLDLSPWLAHLLGAAIGAIVLIEVVGASLPGAHPGLVGWFQATAASVTQAYLDLTWRHQLTTLQYGHFCLAIGIVVWGTAQVASYDVFGYHRSVNAVLLVAVILVANMGLAPDQFWDLVLFSCAALALLLRAHVADERSSWVRHRIWHAGDARSPRSQGGLAFATLAVCGALILTSVASSAPLAEPLSGLKDNFEELGTALGNYLPNGNQTRIPPTADFGSTSKISPSFKAGPDKTFTVKTQGGSVGIKWRVVAYDQFRTTGWAFGPGPGQTNLAADAPLNGGTLDFVNTGDAWRAPIKFVVHVQDSSLKHLILVNEPVSVNVAASRLLVGDIASGLDVVWFASDAVDYTVSASVPNEDPKGQGLTEWRLRNAGTKYPTGLLARNIQGADEVGADGRHLLTLIEQTAAKQGVAMDPRTGHFTNEYDAAKAIQGYLRDAKNFTYNTDITGIVAQCQSISTVDCFALYRQGFCEQYATTMTMLMRMEGFPARYVLGFLPGHVGPDQVTEQVTAQQRHAWVEVYFPTYGWIPFDPTGSVGQPTQLPVGSPVVATPVPSGSISSGRGVPDQTQRPDSGGSTGSSTNDSGTGALLLVVLALVVIAGLYGLLRRRPKRASTPNSIYVGIVQMASRLGYKPAPTQTVYEYTGMLADLVPRAKDPLGLVATAQVEVIYGRRHLGADRLATLESARRRVRQALLRLVFRLPMRRSGASAKGKGKGR
jgi:transglutaminase-like putative cysteine protease